MAFGFRVVETRIGCLSGGPAALLGHSALPARRRGRKQAQATENTETPERTERNMESCSLWDVAVVVASLATATLFGNRHSRPTTAALQKSQKVALFWGPAALSGHSALPTRAGQGRAACPHAAANGTKRKPPRAPRAQRAGKKVTS